MMRPSPPLTIRHALRYNLLMASAAERMRAMRSRRRHTATREVRLRAPDARAEAIKRLVATQVAALDPADEEDALRWIEAVADREPDAAG